MNSGRGSGRNRRAAAISGIPAGDLTVSGVEHLDWGEFFTRYRPLAVRFIKGLLQDPGQAEDVFQEAARSIYERSHQGRIRFETAAHCRNYLFRTMRNLAVDSFRDHRSKKTANLDDGNGDVPDTSQPFDPLLVEEHGMSLTRRDLAIREAVGALKSREQKALEMRYTAGLTFREMADRTGIAISTLQARVESALKKIRKKIGKEFIDA